MSVIISYQNNLSLKNEYLEIRGLGSKIGLARTGTITNSNVIEDYFSIYSINEEYVLNVNDENILLPKYYKMNINNMDFFFYTISPTCESLSYACFDKDLSQVKEKDFITLTINHNLKILDIKLYEGVEYYLGSSKVSSIFLDENFVAPYHTKIKYIDKKIQVIDVAGSLKKEDDYSYILNDILLRFS